MHANIVLAQDFLDYAPLFIEIADAYFEQEMYAEASALYELLGEDAVVNDKLFLPVSSTTAYFCIPKTSNFSILLNAAACRRMLGDLQEAVELYKTG